MADGRDLDKILAALNAASAKARATWVTVLLFGTYLAVAVGATTHRDLFLESPVTLPLLNVELPLFSFYIVAPALFVIMHLYLLVHLYLLGRKIQQFEAALPDDLSDQDQERLRAQLDSFLVLQKLAGRVRGGAPRLLLNLTVWITVIGGPVLLLLAFQVRFLPYHSEAVTWWHRVLILLDLSMLCLLWPSTVHPSGRILPALASPFLAFGRLAHDTYEASREQARRLMDPALSVAAKIRALWSWHRGTVAGTQQALAAPLAVTSLFLATFVVLSFSLLVATVPDGRVENWIRAGGWFSKGEGRFQLADRDGREIWQPTAYFFEGTLDEAKAGLDSWFSRSLVLPDADLIPQSEEELAKVERTLTLRERDLRYAILIGADLRKAELVVPDLRGARLDGAKLAGAQFRCITQPGWRCPQLQSASLDRAELQGALLERAQLQGASLNRAQLQGASLDRAQLQGASLDQAELQGASLDRAQLQGASLDKAQLQGASLGRAQFYGAHLRHTQLQGASLVGTRLQGASLEWAKLQGAWLYTAELHGASLAWANLQGTSLEYSWLWQADINRARNNFLLSCYGANFKPIDQRVLSLLHAALEHIPDSRRQRLAQRRIENLQTELERSTNISQLSYNNSPCIDFHLREGDQELADFLASEIVCNPKMILFDRALGTPAILRRMAEERRRWEEHGEPFRPYHALLAQAVLKVEGTQCAAARAALSEQDLARFRGFLDEAEPRADGAPHPGEAERSDLTAEAVPPAQVIPAETEAPGQ